MNFPLSSLAFLKSLGRISLMVISSAIIACILPGVACAETTSGSGATQIPLNVTSYTISASGTYYLAKNVTVSMASGAFLTVNASNVTIDLNGYTISNSYGVNNTADAILATDRSNITVRNGTTNAFYVGVLLNASSYASTSSLSFGHLIEDVCCTNCPEGGVRVYGYGNRIHRCRCIKVGSSVVDTASAIANIGLYDTVEDCDVLGSTGTATSTGVDVGKSGNCFAVNNRIAGINNAVVCHEASDKFRNNLTAGITTTVYTGGTDAGNNQ